MSGASTQQFLVSSGEISMGAGGRSLRAWRAACPWATDEEVRGWMAYRLLSRAALDGRSPSPVELERLRSGRLVDEFEDLAMDEFGGPPEEYWRAATGDLCFWIIMGRLSRI